MSASLVGSEMCIRDSPTSLDEPRPLCGLLRGNSCLTLAESRVPLLSPRAVSYTHLTLPTICSV
eukprot:1858952-Alexandrium_andersonii.AAC.1